MYITMCMYIYTYQSEALLAGILIVSSKAIQTRVDGTAPIYWFNIGPGPTFPVPFGGDTFFDQFHWMPILEGFSCKTSVSLMCLWLHINSSNLHRASVCNQLLASAVSQTNASPERCRAMSWQMQSLPMPSHTFPLSSPTETHFWQSISINRAAVGWGHKEQESTKQQSTDLKEYNQKHL